MARTANDAPEVAAVRKALKRGGPDGFSSADLAASVPCSVDAARAVLRRLIDAGTVRHAGQAYRTAIDGQPRPVPVYQLVKR